MTMREQNDQVIFDGPATCFQLFIEGDELYRAMLSAIACAESSIRLESYIFADDVVGNQFCLALVERVKAGISVQVHIDAAGSKFWFSRNLQNYLRSKGVELRWFHRWSWRRPWRYNRRNHRKLLIVDRRIAFIGGFNIHRENSRQHYGNERWRDSHVSFTGPLVGVASQLFDAFWRGRLRWEPLQIAGNTRLLHNHTMACRHRLRCVYVGAFDDAMTFIYLTTPYFVPDGHTLKQLCQAAERGVDVRLLVPRRSDVSITRWAARHVYASLLDSGVRIFEYLPRVLHAKTVVVDDGWSMIGTANLDYRSLFVNYELNLETVDRELVRDLKENFLRDLTLADEILPQEWERRGYVSRLLGYASMIVRRWL